MMRKSGQKLFGLCLLLALLVLPGLRPLHAQEDCSDCSCIFGGQAVVAANFVTAENTIRTRFGTSQPIPLGTPSQGSGTGMMGDYQTWMIKTLFLQNILPAMMDMTQQLTTVMMHQTFAIGALIDAKTQLETQGLYQRLTAQAHKDYQPSLGMCVFGTNVRSLAGAESNAGLTEIALSQREQQRELQTSGVSSADGGGADADRKSRLSQFAARYCDRLDNDPTPGKPLTGLGLICQSTPTAATIDKDIDYMRTILLPRTLTMDFSETPGTPDDGQDVLAMASNLYAHDVFKGYSNTMTLYTNNRPTYMDMRAVIAKRSVAEASFNAVAAMKTQGSDDSTDTAKYMTVLMQDLGVPDTEIVDFLGKRPSYMAQMEVLSKKIYQRPEFYTELYDTPENVKRRSVAMQAIGVMLNRDIYKSYLRSEAIMSLLLEMKLMPLQDQLSNKIELLKP